MSIYLTEKRLGQILEELKPNHSFIHDKSVPNSKNKRMRPDFRCDKLKLILEFDGDSHYRSSDRIIKDKVKDADYQSLGYKVFRIPYFIQASENLWSLIFKEQIPYKQVYCNGFIDDKAILPADFCEMGVELFRLDLEKFNYARADIISSLKEKVSKKGNIDLVLPKSLHDLLE
ncbi:DUF559 domain-containing protein [Francisellaceae bacterium CB300]|jgi:hypothetical protein